MEQVAVDITGPLPCNQYSYVALDYFTKWPKAYALLNQEVKTIGGMLVNEFFTRFGVPIELHSEHGCELILACSMSVASCWECARPG